MLMVILSAVMTFADEEEQILRLKIGDKDLIDKVMEVTPGTIYSTNKGKSVPFALMIQEMDKSRFVYIGETHNSFPMHQIQSKVIQALYQQDKNLCVGLEMFPVICQEALNKWSLGLLTEDAFIREGQWYVNWNFNFGFYEEIFRFVKEKSIPVYALNVSRAIISKIRMQGWEALSVDEKELVPKPDLSHEDHRTLIRTIFESTDLPHQMTGKGLEMAFEGLYRAQSAWDETMAFYALKAFEKEDRKMVVLAGSGHLLYNLGINRRVYEKNQSSFKTLVCVVIPKEKESIEISRSLADYVWGLKEEEKPVFPSVGLSLKKFDGLDNLVIDRKPIDGVAKGVDFEKGDVVLSVDGKEFQDINELRIYLAQFSWDDEVKFHILRDAQEIEVDLKFQIKDSETDRQ
jgi:uncharacterized iron-regulated protein